MVGVTVSIPRTTEAVLLDVVIVSRKRVMWSTVILCCRHGVQPVWSDGLLLLWMVSLLKLQWMVHVDGWTVGMYLLLLMEGCCRRIQLLVNRLVECQSSQLVGLRDGLQGLLGLLLVSGLLGQGLARNFLGPACCVDRRDGARVSRSRVILPTDTTKRKTFASYFNARSLRRLST
jgi:hypothetical protein